MSTLSKENRRLLENTVAAVRTIAVKGATSVLRDQLAVSEPAPWPHLQAAERDLRNRLRAHGRQLGDRLSHSGTQEIARLAQSCAYEQWHRMLFARFLAENDLLLDPDHRVALTLEEVKELAREQNRDWLDLAAEFALRMLIAVFQPDDPALLISMPPETRLELEEKLESLPAEIFRANDSLGWVYQFWQRDEKERVNKSEVKIGADELPAATQLFTEDYMVLFLLENTLGAWWTAKRRAEGKSCDLPGYQWTYLRLNDDGTPAAGSFDGWPRTVKELKVLDPCMGSGHFLVFALPILACMRMEEEGLSLKDALVAVLNENLFGLEIDARCSQIAAFNLALAAWRLAGEYFALPELQLACSGLGPNCSKDQWMKLAEEVAAGGGMPAKTNLFGSEDTLLSEPVKRTMEALYDLFSQAPVLGSLINPANLRGNLFEAEYGTIAQLFGGVLNAQSASEEMREQVIAAAGMVKAAEMLSGHYTLVITNVPYVGFKKQCAFLAEYTEEYADDAKHNLATVFVKRCLELSSSVGTTAVVTQQNFLFLGSYEAFRERLLETTSFRMLGLLGAKAFATPMWDFSVCLAVLSKGAPTEGSRICGIDASSAKTIPAKIEQLKHSVCQFAVQSEQEANPNCRITFSTSLGERLERYAYAMRGIVAGDLDLWTRSFWEISVSGDRWRFLQTTFNNQSYYAGRNLAIDWSTEGKGMLRPGSRNRAYGCNGVAVCRMGEIKTSLYNGDLYDQNVATVVPLSPNHLPAIWSYCSSEQYDADLREIDRKLNITNATLVKVPFDLAHWQEVAAKRYPSGLPKPFSSDPTQWLFNGHPKGSDQSLHVAVARLVGYQWPRQTGSSFPDCPAVHSDGLEAFATEQGIVPLSSVVGEASAADRLRGLLADAYGTDWSAAKLQDLLGDWDSLEEWLRDGFFEEHCRIFQQRPFVWHVWDGRKDGFHALVNYHKLAAPNGEGRKTLEKLTYTTLGDWIARQNADITAGVEGADGRLAAAVHLKVELEKILHGEKPYDTFVRWKPLDQQPIGWEPDINDGVRLNIRPWLAATPYQSSRRDACILRVTPKIKFGKDRGKEPQREKEDFPWFWSWKEGADDFVGGAEFDGARWNDPHYSLKTKQEARARKEAEQSAVAGEGEKG